MKLSLGRKADPDRQARMAIRKKKWKQAISYYEKQLKANERDYALWNLLGDLHTLNKSTAQAVEAWRHALEGYALEGLHDSVLGVGRKMLRHAPEEEEITLQIAEACLGLEYFADCLSTFRGYLKLAKHRSEPDMRALFKKIMESEIRFPHLLDELKGLYQDSGLDEIELEKAIDAYIEKMSVVPETPVPAVPEESAETYESSVPLDNEPGGFSGTRDGLAILGGETNSWSGEASIQPSFEINSGGYDAPPSMDSGLEVGSEESQSDLPPGEGKDHYDLGVVYTEMSLWDAAISEFENARRDPTYRHKATLGLANCYQKMNDLQKALNLLESARGEPEAGEAGDLHFQLGEVHELLGNMEEALHCFERVKETAGAHSDAERRIQEIQARIGGTGEEEQGDESR